MKAIRSLANDRSIIIRKAHKGSVVVVLDKLDYIQGLQKHLKDENLHKKVIFKDKNLSELVDKSNHLFQGLKTKRGIID